MFLFEHDLRANAFRVCREGKPVPTFPDHALVRHIIIAAAIIWPAAVIIGSAAIIARRIAVAVVIVIALLLGGDRADGCNCHESKSRSVAPTVVAATDRTEIRGAAGRRGGRDSL